MEPRPRAFHADGDEAMAVVAGLIAARKAAGQSQASLAARMTGQRHWVEFLPEDRGGHDRAG